MYKVKLTEFVKKMNLKSLLPDIDTDSIMIEQSIVLHYSLQVFLNILIQREYRLSVMLRQHI